MKTIGIIGTRQKDNQYYYNKLFNILKKYYNDGDIIVSGGCPQGGDRIANEICIKEGFSILNHYPPWKYKGKFAGHYRNTFIARESKILIAIISDERKGGTENTIKKWKQKK